MFWFSEKLELAKALSSIWSWEKTLPRPRQMHHRARWSIPPTKSVWKIANSNFGRFHQLHRGTSSSAYLWNGTWKGNTRNCSKPKEYIFSCIAWGTRGPKEHWSRIIIFSLASSAPQRAVYPFTPWLHVWRIISQKWMIGGRRTRIIWKKMACSSQSMLVSLRFLMIQLRQIPCAHVDSGRSRLSADFFVTPINGVNPRVPFEFPFHEK